MKRALFILSFIALLAGLTLRPLYAKVFRTVSDTRGRLNAVGLPWEQAYTTSMHVNGVRNDVVVYSARYNEPVVEQLKAQFELQGAEVVAEKSADGGGVGYARWEDGEARFVVAAPDSQPNIIIFLFYPEPGSPELPEFPIADYPQGRVLDTVSNDGTETFCRTLVTADSVMQVQRYYAEVLARDGWEPVLPLRMSNGLSCYRKKEQTCSVLATRRDDSETNVTLLVRDKGF